MDFEDYERDRAEKNLLMKLREAEKAVNDGERWLDLDELKEPMLLRTTAVSLEALR